MSDHRAHPPRIAIGEKGYRLSLPVVLVLVYGLAAGCSSTTYLMPTPNLYTQPDWNPFVDVPPALQTDKISVLYVTDRVPSDQTPGHWEYGQERSRSAAFGEVEIQIGENLSWDALAQESRSSEREEELPLIRTSTNELGRFQPTPPTLVLSDAQLAQPEPASDPLDSEMARRFTDELTRRLAATPRKEVFLYVHGFSNSFEDAMFTIGEIWHFLGREGVPIAYTWPCGVGGIRQYLYTILSGQFTNYHLKQTLRLIASCPEVKKIHLIAHSRGTDVVTTALRELYLEARGTPGATDRLKLGRVVLAAADLDVDVTIEMNGTERVLRAVDAAAVYICHKDKALAFSSWLSLGSMRLGDLEPHIFTREEIDTLRSSQRLQVIDARVADAGSFGHGYFHANPAVSSDIILFLRYQLPPGDGHGRPLGVSDTGFWIIGDQYPGPAWQLPKPEVRD